MPASRAFVPACISEAALSMREVSEEPAQRRRCRAAQAGLRDTICRERGGVKEKNQLGRSLFVSG